VCLKWNGNDLIVNNGFIIFQFIDEGKIINRCFRCGSVSSKYGIRFYFRRQINIFYIDIRNILTNLFPICRYSLVLLILSKVGTSETASTKHLKCNIQNLSQIKTEVHNRSASKHKYFLAFITKLFITFFREM
jgi:hypothetical protein